jgi:acylphosphatase
MIRRTVHFSGHVQGVGFRYTVQDVAREFDVAGYVRNLADGRVEVVAEGEEHELSRFVARIHERMEGFIKKATHDDSPAAGEYRDFSIRH